jgi:serine/threonine-protein kinase HipA
MSALSDVFNYVIGNNDMHLKNFSMFLSESGWVLSPFYDFLNVKMILPEDKEDIALLLGGKKYNINRMYFDRFGTVLGLNEKQVAAVYKKLKLWLPLANQCIALSFLDADRKKAYQALIAQRIQIFS